MPSPYRPSGRGGGRGCTNTGDPTITTTPWSYQEGQARCGSYNRKCSREQNAASQAGTHGSGWGSMLPGAGWIPTSPCHMGQMAHPETGSLLHNTPTGMQNACHSAHAETYGEYEAFHERLRVAVDAGPRPLACGKMHEENGPDNRPQYKALRGPSHQRSSTASRTTTTWRMMKSGQWMELRRDTRPPRTRQRRPAAGAKAMW